MKKFILLAILAIFSICAACGSKTETVSINKANSAAPENKSTNSTSSAATKAGSPAAVVKDVYDDSMRRNCSAIPAKLTEEFKKSVGTSKDELEALCDSFTDSGKLANFEIKDEQIKGDAATVKVSLTFKDGRKEEKDENVKKSGDKWVMDS